MTSETEGWANKLTGNISHRLDITLSFAKGGGGMESNVSGGILDRFPYF